MRARLRVFAAAAVAAALAGCGARLAVKIERIPCPPAELKVSCPAASVSEAGETWEDYRDRVKAARAICAAALDAWRDAHEGCAGRP